jgi:hypothetical protein
VSLLDLAVALWTTISQTTPFNGLREGDAMTHKSGAFRGYRPAVLDGLVHAYHAVSSINYVEQSRDPNTDVRLRPRSVSLRVKFRKSLIREAVMKSLKNYSLT